MCPIIPSDHLSTRIGGWLWLSQGWLCLPYSILILLGDRTVKIDLYPYVYSQFVPLSGEHLTRSRCKSDPAMAGVSALYNQKIILLLPMVSVILSSNKTALGGVETTQYKQYWLLKKKKILVLHCRHDCAHRTRVWIRLFFPKHSHPPTQVQNTQSEHTHTHKYTKNGPHNPHCLRQAALSGCYSMLYHGSVGALSRWLRPSLVHYRHRHTIWALCSGAPAKWALVKIERAQMDREPCHISLLRQPSVKW